MTHRSQLGCWVMTYDPNWGVRCMTQTCQLGMWVMTQTPNWGLRGMTRTIHAVRGRSPEGGAQRAGIRGMTQSSQLESRHDPQIPAGGS